MTTRAEAIAAALEAQEKGSPGVLLDPSFVLRVLAENVHEDAQKLTRRSRLARLEGASPLPTRKTTNHAIRHGRALCGLEGTPLDWPAGNCWVYASDPIARMAVSCLVCRRALGLEAR